MVTESEVIYIFSFIQIPLLKGEDIFRISFCADYSILLIYITLQWDLFFYHKFVFSSVRSEMFVENEIKNYQSSAPKEPLWGRSDMFNPKNSKIFFLELSLKS